MDACQDVISSSAVVSQPLCTWPIVQYAVSHDCGIPSSISTNQCQHGHRALRTRKGDVCAKKMAMAVDSGTLTSPFLHQAQVVFAHRRIASMCLSEQEDPSARPSVHTAIAPLAAPVHRMAKSIWSARGHAVSKCLRRCLEQTCK